MRFHVEKGAARRAPACPEINQHDVLSIANEFRQFVHFSLRIGHFKVSKLLPYGYFLQNLQVIYHVRNTGNLLKSLASLRHDCILLVFIQFVAEVVEQLRRRQLVDIGLDVSISFGNNLAVDIVVFSLCRSPRSFILRFQVAFQF